MEYVQPVVKQTFYSESLRPQRMVFIVNPRAGTHKQNKVWRHIDRLLNHKKFEYGVWFTQYPGHATELARQSVEKGYDIVVAVGGDGSVNEVAAGLIHSKAALGIIPAGSGNGLAMHLGYGRRIDGAIRKLNTASVRKIDCGTLNGRPFINVAGIGFDGLVSNLMKSRQKRGFVPYFLQSLKAGLSYMPSQCTIEANGKMYQEKCFAISVANGPMYGYNFQIAPGARLDDGLFSVVMLKDAPRWQYFAAVPSTLNGRILEEPFVEHFSAPSLTIRSEGENFIHLDGEGFKESEALQFEILPKCINILTPVV